MSRNLSSRHNSFSQPGIASGQPAVQPRPSRSQLVLDAIRAQRAAVEIDGCVALYTALRPSEQKIAERAIAGNHYNMRQQPSGMTVYVVQPQAAPAQPAAPTQPADQPKPKLSKQQRDAAEKKLIKQMAEIAAAAKPAAKPKKLRNRHDDLAAARALKEMVTGQ